MPNADLSAAIKEAYASSPSTRIIYHTLEINHAAFDAPIRVVHAKQAISARLEASAPRNAGSMVTFTAIAFDLTLPGLDTVALPQCAITMDNVDRAIGAALDTAIISGGTTEVIYRAFLSDALAVGPEYDPALRMTLLSVELDTNKVTAVAGFTDLLNRAFPREEYDLQKFPGLAA